MQRQKSTRPQTKQLDASENDIVGMPPTAARSNSETSAVDTTFAGLGALAVLL